MNSYEIFTRRKMGLDRKVWGVMLFCCMVCIALLSYKSIVKVPCTAISITARGQSNENGPFVVNESVHFTASMTGLSAVKWDFGDKSNNEIASSIFHVFKQTGSFLVSATVNDGCTEIITVEVIQNNKATENNEKFSYLNDVIVPSNRYPYVGEQTTYSSSVEAKSYEWWIEGGNEDAKRSRSVSYTFSELKTYILFLKLDNDPKKIYRYPILVAEMPVAVDDRKQPKNIPKLLVPDIVPYIPPPAPSPSNNNNPPLTPPQPANNVTEDKKPEPVAPSNEPEKPPRRYLYKNKDQFKAMLAEVVSSNKNFKDFDPYLCDGGATLVIENGVQTTFERLCQNITGEQRIDIQSVEYLETKLYSDNSRCVKSLKVKYEKKKKRIFK